MRIKMDGKQFSVNDVSKAAQEFVRRAQAPVITSDYSLKENLNKRFGKTIMDMAVKYLNDRAVRAIDVNVNFDGKTSAFIVDSRGSDKSAVDSEFGAALNKKFGGALNQLIMAAQKKNPSGPFSFSLMQDIELQ